MDASAERLPVNIDRDRHHDSLELQQKPARHKFHLHLLLHHHGYLYLHLLLPWVHQVNLKSVAELAPPKERVKGDDWYGNHGEAMLSMLSFSAQNSAAAAAEQHVCTSDVDSTSGIDSTLVSGSSTSASGSDSADVDMASVRVNQHVGPFSPLVAAASTIGSTLASAVHGVSSAFQHVLGALGRPGRSVLPGSRVTLHASSTSSPPSMQ